MRLTKDLYHHSLTLLTDFYQITMAYAYWKNGIAERESVFNLYYRDGIHTGADIYQSRLINGQYNSPEKVKIINTDYYEGCPYIAPDESYIIFCSNRPGGYYNYTELYISFRKKDGSWTQGINMGKTINMGNITCSGMSPDHRYLFFTHRTNGIDDYYWVDAKVIEELRPKN